MKKGDKVKFANMIGILVSNPYYYIADKQRYAVVYFKETKEEAEIRLDMLERV